MKISNSNYIMKGITLAVCGALIAFFPGVISGIFYIIGGIIIAASIIGLFSAMGGGDGGFSLIAAIIGVAVGGFVIYLPHLIMVNIPVIAGVIFGIMGIMRIVNAAGKNTPPDKKTQSWIFAVILIVLSLFCIINPFGVSTIVRIIIGVIMFAMAAFNFYVAYVIKQRNDSYRPDVINAFGTTVDDKHIK